MIILISKTVNSEQTGANTHIRLLHMKISALYASSALFYRFASAVNIDEMVKETDYSSKVFYRHVLIVFLPN